VFAKCHRTGAKLARGAVVRSGDRRRPSDRKLFVETHEETAAQMSVGAAASPKKALRSWQIPLSMSAFWTSTDPTKKSWRVSS
jgi:hypothetical protein